MTLAGREVRLGRLFERRKVLGHVDEPMLSVFRQHGVVFKDALTNHNQTAEDRGIYQLVEPGWLAVNRMKAWQGALGISALRGIMSGHYICFAPVHEEVDRYLHYLLRSPEYTAHFASISRGVRTGQIEIDNDQLAATPLFLPDPREQLRIADFLDDRVARIDRIIAARQAQLKLAASTQLELARGLTTGSEQIGAVETGIAWMPKVGGDHDLWRVGQAFTTGSGTTPLSTDTSYYDGDVPWVTTSDLRDRSISSVPRTVSAEAIRDHSVLKVYPVGTLLVAMYGATVGRAGLLGIPATVNQACCALEARGPVGNEYAFYWFLAHRGEVMGLASGGGQPNISQQVVRSLRIPAPDIGKQREVVRELRRQELQSQLAQRTFSRSVTLLNEYKQSLITAAVKGELDVTTAGSGVPG